MIRDWLGNSTLPTFVNKPKVPHTFDGSVPEVMYQISAEFWDQKIRQEALSLTIERAFAAKNWKVIVDASHDLNPTSQRGPILMRAIKALASSTETGAEKAPRE